MGNMFKKVPQEKKEPQGKKEKEKHGTTNVKPHSRNITSYTRDVTPKSTAAHHTT